MTTPCSHKPLFQSVHSKTNVHWVFTCRQENAKPMTTQAVTYMGNANFLLFIVYKNENLAYWSFMDSPPRTCSLQRHEIKSSILTLYVDCLPAHWVKESVFGTTQYAGIEATWELCQSREHLSLGSHHLGLFQEYKKILKRCCSSTSLLLLH